MELFQEARLLSKLSFLPVQNSAEECDISKPQTVEGSEALRDKVVALYFAASWCPASQQFTPLLRELHDELLRRKAPFEIVAIPCDKTKGAADSYFTSDHGDWLSVSFGDQLIGDLKEQFNVTAIPKLVVLRPNGTVITYRGRKDVQDKGVVCFRGWVNATNLSVRQSHHHPVKTDSSVGSTNTTEHAPPVKNQGP